MIECYKMMQNLYDPLVSKILVTEEIATNRVDKGQRKNNPHHLYYDRCTSRSRNNAFSVRVVNTWNSLPASITTANSLNSFKNKLDYYWKNEALLYDYTANYEPLNKTGREEMPTRNTEIHPPNVGQMA